MLNVFPDLLYPFFAPTLLRVGVAIAFVIAAYLQLSRRDEIAQMRLPLIGQGGWWVWLSAMAHIVVAATLFFGYYTQVAALVGALLGLKYAFWSGKYPLLFPLGRAAGFLIMLICLSLVVSGAGAIARDLPL